MLTLTILIVTLIDMCVDTDNTDSDMTCVDTDNTDSDTNRHVLTLTILIVTLIDMC